MQGEAGFYRQGLAAETAGQFEAALKYYQAALKANPEYRPALLNLGALYSKARRSEKALACFERAREIAEDAAVLFNIGSELYRLDRLPESQKTLKQCLQLDRRLLKAHLLLAYIHGKRSEYDKAVIYFKNALVIDPASRMAALGLTVALTDSGQHELALKTAEDYLRSAPGDATFLKLRSGLLLELGKNDEAALSYQALARTSQRFTSFSDHLKEARETGDEMQQAMFENLSEKMEQRSQSLRARIAARKTQKQALSPEDKQATARELIDLSFLHLFNGDEEKALKLLFDARKFKPAP
ncbi:MAG: tetratricopeptide repeat protein [Spirochaetales bacterium]|nr:tetratricopeptide repeat protein [Spirochaetales bacterium]